MTLQPIALDPELDLVFERIVAVPSSQVWRAWTEPDLLKQWFTPAPWRTTLAELDVRPGGGFRTVMEGPNGERNDSTGCYLEVIPGKRLVWTDALSPGFRPSAQAFMTGIVQFTDVDGGTRYTAIARHANVATKKQHEDMGFHHGWGAALDQLVALMRG